MLRGVPIWRISVLVSLSLRPDIHLNSFKIFRDVFRESRSRKNSVVSSASCDILNVVSLKSNPFMSGLFFKVIDRISTARTNISAERGHPCLIPDRILKYGVVVPLLIIQLSMSVYIIFIQSLNISPKPKCESVFCINFQFNLSKAFSKSRNAKGQKDCLFLHNVLYHKSI